MNVLFLCTGNSCRSQMVEGWVRHLAGERIEAQSAGIESHGKNPRVIDVMREVSVDISAQDSAKLTDRMMTLADYIVTVCGHADEHCPVLPAGVRKEHWLLSDLAKVTGSEDEIMAAFRESRDDIRDGVEDLIERLKSNGR